MKRRTIVFECRFGESEGWGHLARCSALAQAARRREWKALLLSGSDLNRAPREIGESFDAHVPVDGLAMQECPDGLGALDALVVDEMHCSDDEIGRLADRLGCGDGCESILVVGIDDMKRRTMRFANIVVNAEIGLVDDAYSNDGAKLFGEMHCMLRHGFSRPAKIDWRPRSGLIPVFVMIGGTDAFGHGSRVLAQLAEVDGISFAPVFVSGRRGADDKAISETLAAFSDSERLFNLDSAELAAWMGKCSYAVIGCGSSAFELAALKVPFLGLSVVDNQTSMARRIREHWDLPVLHLEDGDDAYSGFQAAFLKLMRRYPAHSGVAYSNVDTKGCDRILDAMEAAFEKS